MSNWIQRRGCKGAWGLLPGVTTFENHQLRQTEERLSKISGNTPLFNTVANTGDKAVQKKAKVTDKDQPLSWGQDPPGGPPPGGELSPSGHGLQ